ncbi:dihydroxyacetone kinase family protein [Brooklawnia cerclae]|uniref:Dihydroxyacetone kinase n=1 Tax=Brooklawnia cerclae TaxID=349934 RepID=A0ABX0SD78_9ACTN|nr:dihydroxyacetone kinase family protein [Brooklawnia cerclae]NIH56353.1 dihydroxyacetone kinase [Brooklawnia cerclae]
MTRLFNDPSSFATEAVAGMASAYPQYLTAVHGGAVRATASPQGQVALVVGGGSGHYPAFAGWVGPGMAHGAVCGNVFASPSASQAYSVVKAADNGGGVVLAYGNYAGDVLHFGQAAERLRAEGIDVRTIEVSDDVASAPADQLRKRRGVCGDVVVFKIAGAAAEAGKSIDEVEALAWKANDRTRSLGVAFDGCTLPGAGEPLFHVPAGQMSVGLGVHGEPGIYEVPMGSAAGVADLLVDGVLAEAPAIGTDGYTGRAIVLLNGLGTIKVEELYVTWNRVAERLSQVGITPVLPEVGELMTSLDMAGVSLTLTFLDDELETLWTAPVDTIAFRRGAVTHREHRDVASAEEPHAEPIVPGSEASRALAAKVVTALQLMQQVTVDKEEELGHLDAIAGDGDHGQGMRFGATGAFSAAKDAAQADAGAGTTLVRAGAQWAESAGGTSGALWGSMLTAIGGVLGDQEPATATTVADAVAAAVSAVQRLGGAKPGDKTIVDSLVPFTQTLSSAVEGGTRFADAWRQASDAAQAAADQTADFVSRLGRSRVLGNKSLGVPDPGAVSFSLLMKALGDAGTFDAL